MYYATQQETVRRNARLLVFLIVITIILIIATITPLMMLLFGNDEPTSLLYAAVFVFLFVGGGTAYRYITISGGSGAIPNQLGAVLVDAETTNFQLKQLRNVVEEISIASGVPVPAIYVLNTENSINAFASGFTTCDAAITVTRGALLYLNRDELQAVIAHEFSHILNGDMRLNLRMVALVFGIMVIGLTGKKLVTAIVRGRVRGKAAGQLFLFGLAIMAIGFTGWFCGRLIKASINRQREFLADASAVQFTRQETGIAGALKKIAVIENGSLLANPNAEEFSQMFFGQDHISWMQMMETHPPIMDRIKILEPSFSDADLKNFKTKFESNLINNTEEKHVTPQTIAATAMLAAAAGTVSTSAVTEHITTPPQPDHYQQAGIIINNLPDVLQTAARNYYGVMPLICALLFSSDAQIEAQQETVVKMNHSETMLASTKSFYEEVKKLDPMQRLPLLSLCIPALRQHPRADLQKFSATITKLIQADQQVTFHEYCLGTMIAQQINEITNPAFTKIGDADLKSAKFEVNSLFTILATQGNSDPAEAEKAYREGMKIVLPDTKLDYSPTPAFAGELDRVWVPLDKLSPFAKQKLIQGLIVTISHDAKITVEESELLRTVCTIVHCPLPPIFQMRNAVSGMTSNSANVTI